MGDFMHFMLYLILTNDNRHRGSSSVVKKSDQPQGKVSTDSLSTTRHSLKPGVQMFLFFLFVVIGLIGIGFIVYYSYKRYNRSRNVVAGDDADYRTHVV